MRLTAALQLDALAVRIATAATTAAPAFALRFAFTLGQGRLLGHARRHDGGVQLGQRLVVAAVDRGYLLARDLLDVLQQLHLVAGDEADGGAVLARAGRAADAVDIGLRHIGQLEVHHVGDLVHVDAARGDVGGDQDAQLAVLERLKRALALRLALVAVDGAGLDAARFQIGRDLVGAVLGLGEDQAARIGRVGEQFGQQGALLALLDPDHRLLDALDRGGLRRDLDLDRILQQLAGQLADLRGHGGREEQVLTLGRDAADDLADRLDEAQVQHLIGFVQDEDLAGRQVQSLLLDVVQQAAGRGHQDIQPLLQGAFLGAVLHAAEDDRHAEAQVGAVLFEAVADLGGQLARRAQDQGARGARARRHAVLGQAMQDRQGEGRRFAGARLGDAQQILALHHVGDGLGLDRRRLLIAGRGQGGQESLVQAHGFKGNFAHVYLSRTTTGAAGQGRFHKGRTSPARSSGGERAPPRVYGRRMKSNDPAARQTGLPGREAQHALERAGHRIVRCSADGPQ